MSRIATSSVLLGSAGGLAIGSDTAALTATLPTLRSTFGMQPHQIGIVVGLTLFGMLIGSAVAGPLASRCGRVFTIRVAAALEMLALVLLLRATTLETLVIARAGSGVALGILSTLCPLILAETAPAQIRGRISGLFQISLSIGVAAAYSVHLWLGEQHWRAIFFCAGFAAIAAAFPRLGTAQSQSFVNDHIRWPDLLNPQYRRPLLLVVLLATFNQFCGVNALVFYRNILLQSANLSPTRASAALLALSIFSALMTCIGVFLIDKAGRRTLLLIGAAGMTLALGMLTVLLSRSVVAGQRYAVGALLLYDTAFSLSQGAVFWVVLPELLPAPVRLQGQTAGAAVLWFWNILITFSFPAVFAHDKVLPFAIFGAMTMIQFVFVLALVPETRGRALGSGQTFDSCRMTSR